MTSDRPLALQRPADRGLHAVVLSGGRSSRMGQDKATLVRDGRSLLEWTVLACRAAAQLVVVGDPVRLDHTELAPGATLRFVREEPPFGGPVAALAAGLAALVDGGPDDWVLVLATDLINPEAAVTALMHSLATSVAETAEAGKRPDCDGTVLIDSEGVAQHVAACYRLGSLRSRLAEVGDPSGASLRRVVQPLRLVPVRAEVGDVDTPDQWRQLTGESSSG